MNDINSKNGSHATQRGLLHRWWFWLVLVVLAGAGAYLYFKPAATDGSQAASTQQGGGKRSGGGRGAAPVVVAATAKTGDINVYLNGLGTVTPLATVTVKTHLAGQLMKVLFAEGQMVKQGQLLAVVDPRPYQVALEQAEGTLAHDMALLQNAKVDLARYQTLYKQDSIQEQQLATQDALVRQYAATVKSDQGAVDAQKLNLIYCNITSPVNGRVGLRLVDAGNIVQPSDANGIVVITQLQPITVVFAIPEDNIPGVMQKVQAGVKMPVDTFDRSQNHHLAGGSLLTLDNLVNVTTGTVNLKAQFANENLALFPGQFVNSRLLLDIKHNATIIPSAGVQRGSQGTYVYIINDDHTVSLRLVKVGVTEGDNSSVDEGLKAGEQVVVDGADKLRDGLKVEVGSPNKAGAAGAASSGSGDATYQHRHHNADGIASATATGNAAPVSAAAEGKWQGHHRDGADASSASAK